jgi:molybdopterin-guanine dinucleotide biosynthesis adapter protein
VWAGGSMSSHPPSLKGDEWRVHARRPLVVSVIGRQNAGKTAVAAKLIAIWTQMGLAVAVLKHDGHADESAADDWEKIDSDTVRMAEAGAALTMVAGGKSTLLRTRNDDCADNVSCLLERMQIQSEIVGQPLDVIVVEGFKSSNLPKLLVIAPTDKEWLSRQRLTDVRAIVQSPLYLWDRRTENIDSLLADMSITHLPSVSFTQKHPRVYHGDNLKDLCEALWLTDER